MTDQLDPALLELQREYLASMPARLDELRSDVMALGQGAPDAPGSLRARFHRLAGSGGSFGFAELSTIAREGERWLATHTISADTSGLASIVERLAGAVQKAETQLTASATGEKTAVTPRALIVMRPAPQRERIAQELRGAGYDVRFAGRHDDPSTIPSEHFPHLVIIGGEAGDRDLSGIASTWTSNPERRPGAVVLVETLRPVDRLRAIAAGVDAIFPAEHLDQKLPQYARIFARIGPPPSSVVLLDDDTDRASRILATLELAHIRVSCRAPAQSAVETLDRQLPDLLLLSTRLLHSDAFALVRTIRQDARYHLLPIVFFGEENRSERIAALRVGADDFVPLESDSTLLVQTVITRAARGRRIRELVYRDGLTGLLNHATLMAELEAAVDYSHRHGEPLAFVLVELDEFRRIGERLDPRAADEVLLHTAAVFRSNVRASDVIGRYRWEAFGVLLRGANAAGATVLAQNLSRVLGEQPATISGGELIRLQVRVAVAVFPHDGTTAAELAQAADRALPRER